MTDRLDSALAGDAEAHRLMRTAHDRSYRYPPDFGGFEAELRYQGPEGDASGTVRITGARSVELTLVAPDAVRGWLRRELGSMIGHRWHLPYEEADGGNQLALSPDDDGPTGTMIDVQQDKYDSSYRLLGSEISQVNRAMGKIRFSIQIQERDHATDGRTLPAHFTVFYWDTEHDRLSRSDVYRDVYETIDGLPLPVARQIISADDDGITTRRMDLSGHRVLARVIETADRQDQLEYRTG